MIDKEKIEYCWSHALIVDSFDKDFIRKDPCGAWIIKNHYGLRDSIFGWEVDHILPIIMGGDDSESNLRAMQWQNNDSKGDDYPEYRSSVTSDGIHNIHKEVDCVVNVELQKLLNDHRSKS